MSIWLRLGSLLGSAKSVQSGLTRAKALVTEVKSTVRAQETAILQESRRRAEEGDTQAQFDLGDDYYFGHSVVQDYAEAFRWFSHAAEKGHSQAQANLGVMFALGRGTERNFIEAVKWLRLAAVQGNAKAEEALRTFYKKLTPEHQAEALRQADEFVAEKLAQRSHGTGRRQ